MAFCLFLTVFSSFSLVLVMAYDEGYGLLLIFLFQVWYFLLLCNIRSLLDQFKSVPTSQMQDLYNEFKYFKILWIVCWTLQRDLNRLAELCSACWLDWVMPIVCAIHPSFDPLIHWSIDPLIHLHLHLTKNNSHREFNCSRAIAPFIIEPARQMKMAITHRQ